MALTEERQYRRLNRLAQSGDKRKQATAITLSSGFLLDLVTLHQAVINPLTQLLARLIVIVCARVFRLILILS
jgi:Flp pilus assembly protein TadB